MKGNRLVIIYAVVTAALFLAAIAEWEVFLAAIAAALVHELGHIFALKAMGMKILGIHIQPGGLLINYSDSFSASKDVIASLAGPAAGFVFYLQTLYLMRYLNCSWLGFSGELSAAYSLFNLLPVFPMDGGIVFSVILRKLLGHNNAIKLCRIIDLIFALGLTAAGLYLLVSFRGAALFAAGLWLLYFQSEDKRCCKIGGNNIK